MLIFRYVCLHLALYWSETSKNIPHQLKAGITINTYGNSLNFSDSGRYVSNAHFFLFFSSLFLPFKLQTSTHMECKNVTYKLALPCYLPLFLKSSCLLIACQMFLTVPLFKWHLSTPFSDSFGSSCFCIYWIYPYDEVIFNFSVSDNTTTLPNFFMFNLKTVFSTLLSKAPIRPLKTYQLLLLKLYLKLQNNRKKLNVHEI